MSRETIQLAYDGDALRTGSMDVRDLAPALLAMGSLCERANFILNGDRATVSVKVLSDFKTGSFGLQLDVAQTLSDTASFLFTHKDQITTAKDILEIIGLVASGMAIPTVSLFKLIKWLKGRKAEKTTILESGATRIYVDNSTHIDVRQEVVRLYNDEEIRRASRAVIKPLERNGIDTLEVREHSQAIDIITREDVASFEGESDISTDVPLIENERDAALVVIKPSFDEDLKWMFSDGESRFNAAMVDKIFLDKLSNRQISFAKGDVLVVRLHSKSFQTTTGIRTEHKVTKVTDIRPSPRQMTLIPPPSSD
jgi:hypothetical protein